MASRFQSAVLASSPSYPHSLVWSQENLLACAGSNVVIILNPALLTGPRGLITLAPNKPFQIGVVERKDLLSGCLLSTCLLRDSRPCVRSFSWSPLGLASNAGCLLAVCTTDGRVNIYRRPFCEFRAEWVELMDVSNMLFEYLASINFGELHSSSKSDMREETESCMQNSCEDEMPIICLKRKKKRKRDSSLSTVKEKCIMRNSQNANPGFNSHIENIFTPFLEEILFPCSFLKECSSVEVLLLDGSQRVWVAGKLDCYIRKQAVVIIKELNGIHDQRVEIDLACDEFCGSDLPKSSVVNCCNHSPKVRPSMNVGNFPEELVNFNGLEKVLRIEQPVEAWTNDRWVEGLFMGFHADHLLVKFHGDSDSVKLNSNSVRLGPVWIREQNSWKVTVIQKAGKCLQLPDVLTIYSEKVKSSDPFQTVPIYESKTARKQKPENGTSTPITADQYAYRNSMLSSTVVAWSPMLQLSSDIWSFLAVGGKSGKISFWRINGPQCYNIDDGVEKNDTILVGMLHAHDAWITTIVWAQLASTVSNSWVLLVTGSSDGSVKIWCCSLEKLQKLSEMNQNRTPLSLLNEVSSSGSIPVSVLSITVPVEGQHKIHLAIGRGSGSFEVWVCDLSTNKFDKVGSFSAHDHVVTGLAWSLEGTCLYSCSQDNTLCSWNLHRSSLFEASIPSNTFGVKSSIDIPNASDSCFGVAISPGNMVLAVVRRFDVELLHPMYQARCMKAVVEFIWIGGQKSEHVLKSNPDISIEAFPGFSKKESVYWESNILWSLNHYEHVDKPLVIWDIRAALLAFKEFGPKYLEHILIKWLSTWFLGSDLDLSAENVLLHTSKLLPKLTSRRLQLLNTICRRVVLLEFNVDQLDLDGLCCEEEDQMALWMELFLSCERELRERIAGFSISCGLYQSSCLDSKLFRIRDYPSGLAQMNKWVVLNIGDVNDKLKDLASEVGKRLERRRSISGYLPNENCNYCSSSVPFESPEVAFCKGIDGKRHKLNRCSVSMRICPSTPLWFCMCCRRWASQVAPEPVFRMHEYPSDFKSFVKQFNNLQVISKPLCPFCGILLQRLQPDFLQSVSSV